MPSGICHANPLHPPQSLFSFSAVLDALVHMAGSVLTIVDIRYIEFLSHLVG